MQANRGSIVRGAALAILSAIVLAVPGAPLSATTQAAGSATATNTLLSLSAGSTRAAVGVDRASSTLSDASSAEAAVDLLTAGSQVVAGGSKTASGADDSGSEALGTGRRSLAGLGSVDITGAKLEASVDAEEASSSATVTLVDADLLAGLVTAGTAQTSTVARAGIRDARVTRTVRLGAVEVLSIRSLLERLGVDPGALTCAAVESAGAQLGVATGTACETIVSIYSAVTAARGAVGGIETTLEDDLAAAQATIAGLTIVTPQVAELGAAYGVDLGGLLGLPLPSTDRDALVAEITRRLDETSGALGAMAAGTCAAAAGALDGLSAAVVSLGAQLASHAAAIDGACDTLAGLLEDLLDVSLLGLDGVRISLDAKAATGAPFADGSGSIGTITVGNRSIALAGLTSVSTLLDPAVATARTQTRDALNALGIATFPEPELDILAVDESTGRDAQGRWFATVRVTGLHVGIPSVPISLPAGTSVGDVLGSASAPASAAAPLAAVPPISVDAAVFTGDARFLSASGTGDDGDGPLPRTGLPASGLAITGVLALLAAAAMRRALRAGR